MTEETEGKKISLNIVGSEQVAAPAPKPRSEGGDIMSEIEHEVTSNRIVLYMKGTPDQPMCGFSAKASQIIAAFGEPFHTVNILEDPEKRQAIKVFSDWPTIPQIYVDGEFLGGSDILGQMYENGQLEDVLKGE